MKPVKDQDLVFALQRSLGCDAEAREAKRQLHELQTGHAQLTPRERELLALAVRGLLNKQIASELGTGKRTIKAHRARVMAKMQAQSVTDLVRMAERLGL
jgi:FixJ family two-component response regulator